MRTNLHRVMFFAAAAFVATGTVWAQAPVTATVSFDFQVGTAKLPAGEYELSRIGQGVTDILLIQDAGRTGKGALSPTQFRIRESATAMPHLTFKCFGRACSLVEMWDGASGYRWTEPKAPKDSADTRIAVINLNQSKGGE